MTVLMPAPVFRWFVAAQNGTGLVPAAGYKAKFYSAGTTDAKTIYLDSEGTPYPSPSNEAVLNSEGYATIFLGSGTYKLIVTDPDDAPVFTLDNISGVGSFGTGFIDTVIGADDDGLAEADTAANHFVWCAGYWAIGDGGHGFFWNETSSTPDDGGYVIASVTDPTKRWFRVPDESGDVRAASFGYIGTKTGNLSNEMLAACSYASTYGYRLIIGPGNVAVLGTDESDFYLYAPTVYLESGSMLTGTGDFENFVFVGYVSGTSEQHFTLAGATFLITQTNENPEWFGASYNSLDNTAAFAKWFACGAGAFVLPPGAWKYANTGTFVFPEVPLVLLGSIDATTGSDIPSGYYGADNSRFRFHQLLFPNGATITEAEGGGIEIIGTTSVVGNLSTTTDSAIDSGANMSAQGSISSGFGATGGNLNSRAGTSSKRFNASGRYATIIGSAVTSGTGANDLLFTTLAQNSIVSDGDAIRIKIAGGCSITSGNRLIQVKIDSTVVAAISGTLAGDQWSLTVEVFKNGSNFQSWWTGGAQSAATSTADIYSIDTLSGAMSFTGNMTVKCVGTAAAGTITNTLLTMEILPAP